MVINGCDRNNFVFSDNLKLDHGKNGTFLVTTYTLRLVYNKMNDVKRRYVIFLRRGSYVLVFYISFNIKSLITRRLEANEHSNIKTSKTTYFFI